MERKLAVSMFGQKRLSREGGIEIVAKELCTRMVQNGCTVTCYNRSGHHVSGAEYDNKTEYAVGVDLGETMGNIIAESYKLMVAIQPDAVLVLGDTNSCLSVIGAKRLHGKENYENNITYHGSWYWQPLRNRNQAVRAGG